MGVFCFRPLAGFPRPCTSQHQRNTAGGGLLICLIPPPTPRDFPPWGFPSWVCFFPGASRCFPWLKFAVPIVSLGERRWVRHKPQDPLEVKASTAHIVAYPEGGGRDRKERPSLLVNLVKRIQGVLVFCNYWGFQKGLAGGLSISVTFGQGVCPFLSH